jgi:hypothetical protein
VFVPVSAAIALLTIGRNDLLRGLTGDEGAGMQAFEAAYHQRMNEIIASPLRLRASSPTLMRVSFGATHRGTLTPSSAA